jgi:hypothetical protein
LGERSSGLAGKVMGLSLVSQRKSAPDAERFHATVRSLEHLQTGSF